MQTTEELEEATKKLEAELAAARAKKQPKKVATVSVPENTVAGPRRVGNTPERKGNSTLKNAHSVPAGRTIIQRIEAQMDKRRKAMAQMVIDNGGDIRKTEEYILQKGRYQGFAGTLALLRSSSVQAEIARSDERLGIE